MTILPGVTAPDVCKIFLKVEASGYADRTLFVELPVLKENDTEWGHYNRVNNYLFPGEMLELRRERCPAPTQVPRTTHMHLWMSPSARWMP